MNSDSTGMCWASDPGSTHLTMECTERITDQGPSVDPTVFVIL